MPGTIKKTKLNINCLWLTVYSNWLRYRAVLLAITRVSCYKILVDVGGERPAARQCSGHTFVGNGQSSGHPPAACVDSHGSIWEASLVLDSRSSNNLPPPQLQLPATAVALISRIAVSAFTSHIAIAAVLCSYCDVLLTMLFITANKARR